MALEMVESPAGREHLRTTLVGFFLTYLPHYVLMPPADFHREMFDLLGAPTPRFISITGFRGCAKSTAAGLALPLWLALTRRAHFIIIINETEDVVKLSIANIRQELEQNAMIQADFGNLLIKQRGNPTKFTETNILLTNGVRILGISRGQKIRGLRHRQYRPDFVLLDDVEERKKVQSKEYRDETEAWLRRDVIPAIDERNGRLVVIGNLMHMDALMARLKADDLFEKRDYALLRPDGSCTWPAKYPTQESLDEKRREVKEAAWLSEYLLKPVMPDGQDIKPEWIQHYDDEMLAGAEYGSNVIGVDLAISKSDTADYTTMVTIKVATLRDGSRKLLVQPSPINARLSMLETVETATALVQSLRWAGLFVEDVGYQRAAIEVMQQKGLTVTPVKITTDKRARLKAVSPLIQAGTVLFPKTGCEDLITQVLYMGVEEHDDLVDAMVHAINAAQEALFDQKVTFI